MFEELPDGETHSHNDGCGEPAHNDLMTKQQILNIVASLDLNGKITEQHAEDIGMTIAHHISQALREAAGEEEDGYSIRVMEDGRGKNMKVETGWNAHRSRILSEADEWCQCDICKGV